MGTPDFAVPALKALAARHDIACVYSQPPRPAGRGQKDRASPVHQAALGLGLTVRHPESLRQADDIIGFRDLAADVAVIVAYGLILPPAILSAPRHGCVNIHASLLPRWRGAAPIHRAVMAGDRESGVAIMQMDAGLDTGPVLLHQAVPIGPGDTTGDLHDRLAQLGAQLILAALDGIDTIPRTPQPAQGTTYAAKISKAEARLDWSRAAEEVDRMIRGLSPFPGAWCLATGERLKILRSRLADGSGAPGQVLGGLTIACGTGAVEIVEAQREGRKAVSGDELLRGWGLPERLE